MLSYVTPYKHPLVRYANVCTRETIYHSKSSRVNRSHKSQTCTGAASSTTDAVVDPLGSFVSQRPWVQQAIALHQDVKAIVCSRATVLPAPTLYSTPEGSLTVLSVDQSSASRLNTSHMTSPQAAWIMEATGSLMGMFLHSKIGIHIRSDYGTPFLEIEISGSGDQLIMWAALTPRLSLVTHPQYGSKYFKTRPADGVLTFEELYKRCTKRVEEGVYKYYVSPALDTRILMGPTLSFTFAPTDEAFQAVGEDLQDLTALWLAWLEQDAQSGQLLTGADLEECRAVTQVMENYIQRDPGTENAAKLLGADNLRKLVETVNGSAALDKPWLR